MKLTEEPRKTVEKKIDKPTDTQSAPQDTNEEKEESPKKT